MKHDNMLAMILAGGRGTRLHDLTKKVAKPAVSYGGKYRIIDFPLSNCANSGIDIVGVLTQYESVLLNSYAAAGRRWGLDAKDSGVYVLPPREKADANLDVYRGTADAISQNIDFIDTYSPDYLLILSGDHIYKMNYDKMLEYHKQNNADATIAVIEVPMKEASRFGIMNTDETGHIVEFEEKPEHPKSNLASMGIYIFNWKLLRKMLLADMMPGSSSLKECPYLLFSLMTKEQVESYCGDILTFIKKTINLGGYVYGVFDEAKILCDSGADYKFPHELFIYGYDDEEQQFYVGDFTFGEHYSYSKVSYSDVRNGYDTITAQEDHIFKDDYKGRRGIYVIQKNLADTYYELDTQYIKDTIIEYLESKDTKNHFRMMRNRFKDTVFGVDVYDAVLKQIGKQLSAEDPDFDIRALHILYDHKVLMMERLKYMMDHGYIEFNGDILNDYMEVENTMLTARNLLIKTSITGKVDCMDRFEKYLMGAKEKEIAVLGKVVELL